MYKINNNVITFDDNYNETTFCDIIQNYNNNELNKNNIDEINIDEINIDEINIDEIHFENFLIKTYLFYHHILQKYHFILNLDLIIP